VKSLIKACAGVQGNLVFLHFHPIFGAKKKGSTLPSNGCSVDCSRTLFDILSLAHSHLSLSVCALIYNCWQQQINWEVLTS